MTPNRFVEVTSTAIAKIFGLYPRKGTIAPGADADIVIFDPEREHVFSPATSLMNVDYDLWDGQKVAGSPRQTLSRGRVVLDDGKIVTRPGHGRFVKRSVFKAARTCCVNWDDAAPIAVASDDRRARCGAAPRHGRRDSLHGPARRSGVAEASSPLPPTPAGSMLARLRVILPKLVLTAPRRERSTSTSSRTRSTTSTRRTSRRRSAGRCPGRRRTRR